MSYTKHNFTSSSHLYASQLNEIDDGIKSLDSAINGNTTIEYSYENLTTSILSTYGMYNKNTKGFYANSSYRAYLEPCSEGDVFKCSSICNDAARLAMFYSGEPSASTFLGCYPAESETLSGATVYTDELVTIPSGCKYVAFNFYKRSGSVIATDFVIKKQVKTITGNQGIIGDIKNNHNMYCIINGSTIDVVSRYNGNKYIVMQLAEKGGNGLFDFHTIGFVENNNGIPTSISGITYLFSNTGDWHSPMIVQAEENGDGDNPESNYFTGGNHQYNNGESGSTPTARSGGVKIYCDGQLATSSCYCDRLEIKWVNYVQAYNTSKADGTGREVIREEHEILFDGYDWISTAHIIPLENVYLKRWYAFQWFGTTSIYKYIQYIGGANRLLYDGSDGSTTTNTWNVANMKAYGDEHEIQLEVDKTYDCGDFSLYGTSRTQSMFTSKTATKGYCWLVQSQHILEGCMYSARARYRFCPHITFNSN